jgi:hypothetical protein
MSCVMRNEDQDELGDLRSGDGRISRILEIMRINNGLGVGWNCEVIHEARSSGSFGNFSATVKVGGTDNGLPEKRLRRHVCVDAAVAGCPVLFGFPR